MKKSLRKHSLLGVYYYIFNTARAPLNDARVRKALAISIDRQAIINSTLKAGQAPALNFVPPNCGGYTADAQIKIREDITLAKKLLAEAGYPNGKNFPALKLTYNTSELHKPIAEAIQQMWKKNLGVEIELYNLSWPAYLDARKRGDFDIARASWIADYPAPENFLENFASDNALNHSKYSDKKFDDALAKAKLSKDDASRMKACAQAETRLMQTVATMPIYFYSKTHLVSPLVRGWSANPLDFHNFQGVSLDANKTAEVSK